MQHVGHEPSITGKSQANERADPHRNKTNLGNGSLCTKNIESVPI
jgi:hypothetical protein